jgi:hypothetical protein
MGGNLRAGPKAGRLQRTLAMRAFRAASASVLALFALLVWRAVEPSALRADRVDPSTAVANALATHVGAVAAAAEQRLSSHETAQFTRGGSRLQPLARSRATDGDGALPHAVPLASASVQSFADATAATRARLRRHALGHAPYGETSPFDATAPPASSPRNG